MKKKYIIGICSVGEQYHAKTIKLIKEINALIDIDFLVLTDEPKNFEGFPNVFLEKYQYKSAKYLNKIFSFHDKKIIFERGFLHYDTVLLLDADHSIRPNLYEGLLDFDSDKISYGAYPQIIWRHPADCSIENFLCGLTGRVPYGIKFKEYAISKNYNLDGAFLIQESFLLIKSDEKSIFDFLKIWDDLSVFCEEQDIIREQHVLGYGEGYSIGVSLNTAGIKIIEDDSCVNRLSRSFKHFAWEK